MAELKINVKNLTDEEYLSCGSVSCAGCGALLALRIALKVLGPRTIFINPTGCLAVIMQMGVPRVPHLHPLFENGPALISGIDTALDVLGKRDDINLLCMAGDGGTADIGLGALSAAVERNQRFIYICYDNESYMNTGGQRSGTTLPFASTTTTPVGEIIRGEDRPIEFAKDVAEIMIAQNCPYVAVASVGYPLDFANKVKKASEVNGPSYIHIHSACPAGWRTDPKDSIKICKLAVQTGLLVLYEAIDGKKSYNHMPKKRKKVDEYLKIQGRFKHMNKDEIEILQKHVDEKFKKLGLE